MDHAITVKDILVIFGGVVGVIGIVAIFFAILDVIARGFDH